MENFIVSARKYRPSTFEMVVGQKSITNTLKNAIKNNQLAQAFLFCGPRGVGKTTCARILAKTINCTHVTPEFEACNECPSCLSFNELTSFNIHELDAASNNSVDDIRSLVDQVRIPPQAGKYKVYIIDEVHMLSSAAFNAFLKTLEEPPAYAKFILATTEKHKILPTILSRCQIFDFRRIMIDDIAQHLAWVAKEEGITTESDALHLIAQKADGALRDALSIFDQIASSTDRNITYQSVLDNLNILDYEFYFKMTSLLLENEINGVLLQIDQVIDNGFDGHHYLAGFASHLRDLLVCKDPATLRLLETGENIRKRYQEQSQKCPVDFLMRCLNIANACDTTYKISNNKRLHLELAFMQMCTPTSQKQPTQDAEALKKKDEPLVIEAAPVVEAPVIAENPAPKSLNTTVERVISSKSQQKAVVNMDAIRALKNQPAPDKEKTDEEIQDPLAFYGTEPFTQEQLEAAWARFAEGFFQQQPNYYSTLTRRKPTLSDNAVIDFIVDNKVQAEEINQKKYDMLAFLRKELKNGQVSINTSVTQNTTEDRPYTSVDKFKKMAEMNPALNKLKNQLDLEIDY
ncbi:MAG: DNA polymerase III subunit gamma/tau [Bacteroidota bacterium]